MFARKTFGRRTAPLQYATSQPLKASHTVDQADRDRVLPGSLWEGEHRKFLEDTGFTPDDPRNLRMTHERMTAMQDAAMAQMKKLVEKLEAHVRGIAVGPYAVIPWSVWEGPNREFLFKQDFLPASPWNTLIFPLDEPSAAYLGLPLHPGQTDLSIVPNLSDLVTELREEHDAFIARGLAAMQNGDFSPLDQLEEQKITAFKKMLAMMRYLATETFGPEVIKKHDEWFGIGLSSVTD